MVGGIVALDRITKEFVWQNWRDYVVWNTGISLGFLSPDSLAEKLFLQIFIVVIIVFFLWWLVTESRKSSKDRTVVILLGLVIAGGVSNFVDRVIWGRVMDFIPFFSLWTFNIADFSITIGVLGLIFGKGKEWIKKT